MSAESPAAERRRDLLGLAAVLLPVTLLLWPVAFAGRAPLPDYLRLFAPWADGTTPRAAWNPLWYDSLGQYWPWRTLLHDGLRANTMPFWNPYQFAGYAFAGNGQSALFYPFNWVFFGLFSVAVGFRLTVLFHLWVAGGSTYWLLRELGARRAAAVVAGLTFGLCGFMVTWLTLPTLLSSAAWLPGALACLERARRTGRPLFGVGAGVCLGRSALAGHPQVFYYVALTVAAVGVVRLLPRQGKALLAAAAVSALLAAPAVLPVLELAPRGHRPPAAPSPEGYAVFLDRAIPSDRLITLVLPRFYGSPERGTADPFEPGRLAARVRGGAYWGFDRRTAISPGDFTEFNLYVGGVSLLLLLYGLVAGGAAARVYGGVGLLALLLASGAPLNRPLYLLLPGYAAGAGPCRLALVWSFGAAVAAGLGLDAAARDAAAQRRLVVAACGLVALVLLGLIVARARVADRHAEPLLVVATYRQLVASAGAVVVVLLGGLATLRAPRWVPLVVATELVLFGWGFTPTCPDEVLQPDPPPLVALRDAMTASHARLVSLDSPRAWGFYHAPRGLLLPPNLATPAGLRDLGGYDSLLPAAHKQLLFQAVGGRFVSPPVNGNMLLLGELTAGEVPPGTALALGPVPPGGEGWTAAAQPVFERSGPEASRVSSGSSFAYDGLNRVALRVEGDEALLRDSADPGWRCFVKGETDVSWRRAAWQPAQPYGRQVRLDHGGRAQVRWVYAPTSVRLGLLGLLLGVAVITGSGVALRETKG